MRLLLLLLLALTGSVRLTDTPPPKAHKPQSFQSPYKDRPQSEEKVEEMFEQLLAQVDAERDQRAQRKSNPSSAAQDVKKMLSQPTITVDRIWFYDDKLSGMYTQKHIDDEDRPRPYYTENCKVWQLAGAGDENLAIAEVDTERYVSVQFNKQRQRYEAVGEYTPGKKPKEDYSQGDLNYGCAYDLARLQKDFSSPELRLEPIAVPSVVAPEQVAAPANKEVKDDATPEEGAAGESKKGAADAKDATQPAVDDKKAAEPQKAETDTAAKPVPKLVAKKTVSCGVSAMTLPVKVSRGVQASSVSALPDQALAGATNKQKAFSWQTAAGGGAVALSAVAFIAAVHQLVAYYKARQMARNNMIARSHDVRTLWQNASKRAVWRAAGFGALGGVGGALGAHLLSTRS